MSGSTSSELDAALRENAELRAHLEGKEGMLQLSKRTHGEIMDLFWKAMRRGDQSVAERDAALARVKELQEELAGWERTLSEAGCVRSGEQAPRWVNRRAERAEASLAALGVTAAGWSPDAQICGAGNGERKCDKPAGHLGPHAWKADGTEAMWYDPEVTA